MLISLLLGSAVLAVANLVPTPKDTKIIPSENYPGASISYKETKICETTPGVKAYSGYVTVPTGSSDNAFNTSLFFWYFEARNNPSSAPVSIYVSGGPGTSSLDNINGFPCNVNEDSNTTTLNPWSWNTNVNMLYIDIPSPAGFSFVAPVDGVLDLLSATHDFTPVNSNGEFGATNMTMVKATLSGQNVDQTVNSSKQVSSVMWDVAQVWFQEFPEHKTSNEEVSLWTVSYGGIWGPAIFSYFERQNDAIADGSLNDPKAKPIKLGTLGIQNGCMDPLVQGEAWPEFAHQNTYGIEAIPQDVYDGAMKNFSMPGGCKDRIIACRAAATEGDAQNQGTNETVNGLCADATIYCFENVQGAYSVSGRNAFDITQFAPSPDPPSYQLAFYNQPWVQEALGAAVNFTQTTDLIRQVFFGLTGDPARGDISTLEYILSRGVKLALVYGDRDYRCNWIGGEKVSLEMNYPSSKSFRGAGYAPISTNETYQGGFVRQHGNVSFSRVFEAGHGAAWYQPETAFQIFDRSMFAKDVATGKVSIGADGAYSSKGNASVADVKNDGGPSPEPICFVLAAPFTCTPNQLQALADSSAVIENYIVTSPKPDRPEGDESSSGSTEGKSVGLGLSCVSLVAVTMAVFVAVAGVPQ